MEHPGNQEGGNVIQDDIGAAGTQASTTVCGREPPGTGGAPDSSRTVSPNAPNLALGTAADGAVALRREGEHPSQTGGSPAFPRTRGQNDSNPSLGTAANGAETSRKTRVHSKRVRPAEPAASQPGKSAKHSNLTGRSLGQGISFQNQLSSGSELSEAYSWLRYVPNRLRQRVLPTVASIQDQCWCFSMRGRMILFLWIVVFTPIIHGYRHMLWHLIPGDHLNHWAMIY